MNEKDMQLYVELDAVLNYINTNLKTKFKLQIDNAFGTSLTLINDRERIFKGKLGQCDNYVAGMLILARILMQQQAK